MDGGFTANHDFPFEVGRVTKREGDDVRGIIVP